MPTTEAPHSVTVPKVPVTPNESKTASPPEETRNIAVAYEPVVLTEEDAEILRQVRENPNAPAGRPTRAPRNMHP